MIARFIKNENFILFICGILSALALPPLYILPAAIIGFSYGFLKINEQVKLAKVFKLGFLFGCGHFLAGLYWISIALTVDIAAYWWLIPITIIGFAAIVGLYPMFCFVIYHLLKPRNHILQILLFSICWVLIEYLRSILFTGFPWNLIGYSFAFSLPILQIAAFIGIWGLSFLTILFFISFAAIIKKTEFKYIPAAGISIIFIAIFIFGYYRLENNPVSYVKDVNIKIIQAGIDQELKWDPKLYHQNMEQYIRLSSEGKFDKYNYIIWPESAIPYIITNLSEDFIRQVREVLPPNSTLITGAVRADLSADFRVKKVYNSMLILNNMNDKLDFYDKSHLVPFGEYIPLRDILSIPFGKITQGLSDFTPGKGPVSISVDKLVNISPLICYEVIFPDNIIDQNNYPNLLVNITNDAWYKKSSGPFQHFKSAQLRSIEYGIPLVRAANTGISALIDPMGRIEVKSKLFTSVVLDSALPVALKDKTIYAKYTNKILIPLLWISLLIFIIYRIYYRYKNDKI